jgi:MinD-like ATPase involved in chromosome partitioning or flagellar assembly
LILTVLGVKGGVGKSTVSIGVAVWMSKKKRVLLLDGDPRVRSVELKLRPKGKGSLFDILSGKLGWREAVHPCHKAGLPNLSVIPSGRLFLPPGEDWVERLRLAARSIDRMLEEAKKEFDHIVIDTPPSVGYEHLLLTAAGEKVLWVCEPNDDSILSTRTAAQDFSRICELEPAGVVLSKVLDRGDLREWVRKAKEIAPVLGVVPFDEAAERAFRRNMPVVLDAPQSRCSKSLKQIAQKLLRMEGRPVSVEWRLGLMLEKLGV